MPKESLKSSGHEACRRLCLLLLMIAWSLLGFVAGLVVGTMAIRNGYWVEGSGGGGRVRDEVDDGVNGGSVETHVRQSNCIVKADSYNLTSNKCSWCAKTRLVIN